MLPKVLSTSELPKHVEAWLRERCDLTVWTLADADYDEEQFIQQLQMRISEQEGLLAPSVNITDQFLQHANKLKVVSNISVGYNNMDVEAMKNKGVIGTNTPHVLDDTVADLAMGLMLSAARKISEMDRYIRAGKWTTSIKEPEFGIDVHHRTLGIIGMGRIGESIAKRAVLGFDMKLLYHNRSRKSEVESAYGAEYRQLHELLAESDFVLMMTPLTKETWHMIGENELSHMKPDAFFINLSRGQTVDEQALIRVLQDGKIRGAALDVFEQEPLPSDHPFLTMEQVVLAPHIGSATVRTRDEMAMLAATNLIAALQGKEPPNRVC